MLIPGTIAGAATPIDPKNPPQGRFADDWMEVYMADGKVGFGHSTMTRDGNLIHTKTFMRISIGRVDSPVTIEMTQQTTESLEGQPISFESNTSASIMQTTTRGKIQDGKVKITTSQYGMEQEQQFDYSPGALMTWGMFRETLLRGFEPGLEYTLDVYVPELRYDGAVKATTVIGNIEQIDPNSKRRGQHVTVTMESPIGEMTMESWLDSSGQPIKSVIPAPGMGNLIMLTTDQETALKEFAPPELFMRSTIRSNVKIDRDRVRQIKYVLSANGLGETVGDIPETGMQRAKRLADGSVEVIVTRQDVPLKPTAIEKKIDRREFLRANLMMNTKDPELVALAKRAAGSETDVYKLIDKLRRFVTDYIVEKNLTVGFATASEVCRKREGDCSEHGVLLAALGRINNLPSRVVVGLAYVPVFGGEKDIFGYHMWTQFLIDSTWVDADAALRETNCSPARIAFATSSLQHSGLADLSLPLISKLGAIDVRIVEIDGQPVDGDPAGTSDTVPPP